MFRVEFLFEDGTQDLANNVCCDTMGNVEAEIAKFREIWGNCFSCRILRFVETRTSSNSGKTIVHNYETHDNRVYVAVIPRVIIGH